MNIQSLSIVVPTKRCVNNCPFCVSRMHDNEYATRPYEDYTKLSKRLKYAINNNINTCIITGTGEALQNKKFMGDLITLFETLDHPFPNIELQTTGVFLNDKENIKILHNLGVNTISLSVSDIFDNDNNLKIIRVPKHLRFDLEELIQDLKDEGFNIRLSINMIKLFDSHSPNNILLRVRELAPDHVTFRQMYYGSELSEENHWVTENKCSSNTINHLSRSIKSNGTKLYNLPYGAPVYSFKDLSIVIDDDCMAKNNNESLKYIILREDGKLYCRWDDLGSLIF